MTRVTTNLFFLASTIMLVAGIHRAVDVGVDFASGAFLLAAFGWGLAWAIRAAREN